VTAADAGGASAPVTATAPDTTPAAAPSGVAVSADGTALTGTGEPGSTITVKAADGTTLGTATAGADGKFSVALSPVQNDGQSLSVTAADAGGASSPVAATAPDTTPAAAPADLAVSADGTALTGTGEPGSTVTVKDPSGAAIGTATVGTDGHFSVSLVTAQIDGQNLTVSASDAGGTSTPTTVIAPNIELDLLSTQTLDGVNNLDVKSALVVSFDQAIKLGTGKITVHDDMGTNGWTIKNTTTGESIRDTYDNDVVITLTDGVVTGLTIGGVDKTSEAAGSVTVNGNKLIIDPAGLDSALSTDWDFDWDFGANYHVSLDAGAVKAASSDRASALIDGSVSLNFTTVTPADAAAGAASQAFNTATGALEGGVTYHNAHVSDITGTAVALDFSSGKHALVMQDAGQYQPTSNYRVTTIAGYVSLTGFGADDLIYMDNMGNESLQTWDGQKGGGQWNKDLTLNQIFRSLGNIDGGLEQRVLFADYTKAVTNLGGADKMFEDATHWNANVVIYA
jgi:hypothetical protein